MRVAALALAVMTAASSYADRLIWAPTGTKVRYRHYRLETILDRTTKSDYRAFLAVSLTREMEAEFLLDKVSPRPALGTFNFAYNYIPAITDTTPGISIGVRDAANRTEDGRLYYLAVTYRMGQSGDFNSGAPFELTLGGGFGRRSAGFVGVQMPFTWQFRMLAEHDLNRVTAGLEYQPIHGAALRLLFQDRRTLWSLRWTGRF